jgi:hypothetical protein
MKSVILQQVAADLAAARVAAAAAKAAKEAAALAASIEAARQATKVSLATKADRREQLLARKTTKIQPHGWTAETAAKAAAQRAAEEAAAWTALAKAKAKTVAKAAGVLSLTALQLAKPKAAKAKTAEEVDVYSTSYTAKQERKALLASIAEYRSAIKWAAKKGRNMALLARLVLKEAMPVAAAKAVVAKLSVKRQPKVGNKTAGKSAK